MASSNSSLSQSDYSIGVNINPNGRAMTTEDSKSIISLNVLKMNTEESSDVIKMKNPNGKNNENDSISITEESVSFKFFDEEENSNLINKVLKKYPSNNFSTIEEENNDEMEESKLPNKIICMTEEEEEFNLDNKKISKYSHSPRRKSTKNINEIKKGKRMSAMSVDEIKNLNISIFAFKKSEKEIKPESDKDNIIQYRDKCCCYIF